MYYRNPPYRKNHARPVRKHNVFSVPRIRSGSLFTPDLVSRYPTLFFAVAIALCALIKLHPDGRLFIYPLGFLSTWSHELFHCLAAEMVGGSCMSIQVFENLSGLAYISRPAGGVTQAIVSVAGLLGPAIVGSVLMVLGIRPAFRDTLYFGLIIVLLFSLIYVEGLFTAGVIVTLAISLLLAAKLGAGVQYIIIQVLGIQWHLQSLDDWGYMFTQFVTVDGRTLDSDSESIAQALGGTYMGWGMVIAGFMMLLLMISVISVTRYLARR